MGYKQKPSVYRAPASTARMDLVNLAADCWTTQNLGMEWPESHWAEGFAEAQYDEDPVSFEKDLQAEFKRWVKHAKRCYTYVVKKKLPKTMHSMEEAFSKVR